MGENSKKRKKGAGADCALVSTGAVRELWHTYSPSAAREVTGDKRAGRTNPERERKEHAAHNSSLDQPAHQVHRKEK